MAGVQVDENTALLMSYRDNILSILNQMQSMGGVMADMPALPVRLNVELANNFLPKSGMGGPATLGMAMQVHCHLSPALCTWMTLQLTMSTMNRTEQAIRCFS